MLDCVPVGPCFVLVMVFLFLTGAYCWGVPHLFEMYFGLQVTQVRSIVAFPYPVDPCSILDLGCGLVGSGFLVPALFGSCLHLLSEVCACFWGNICERFARRDLC